MSLKKELTAFLGWPTLKRFDGMLFDNSDETSLKRTLSQQATKNSTD